MGSVASGVLLLGGDPPRRDRLDVARGPRPPGASPGHYTSAVGGRELRGPIALAASDPACGSDSELRVQDVAEPVADQVDAERGERQRGAGERGEPPGH